MDNRIEWLMHFPYREESKDMFYYKTIHVEDGYMITTDGRWMRICNADEDEEPGDYLVTSKGMRVKQSDRFWYFPPAWKKIMQHIDDTPDYMAESVTRLAKHIFKNDLDKNISVYDLAMLEENYYTLTTIGDGDICLFRADTRFFTVF